MQTSYISLKYIKNIKKNTKNVKNIKKNTKNVKNIKKNTKKLDFFYIFR